MITTHFAMFSFFNGMGTANTPPIILVDTHDGYIDEHKKRNDERKERLIAAFEKITGVAIPQSSTSQEVARIVQAKIIKPRKHPERNLLKAAAELKAFADDTQKIFDEYLARQEDDAVADYVIRVLH